MIDSRGRTPLLSMIVAALSASATAQSLDELSLEQLGEIQIQVASRVSGDANQQPASVTTLDRNAIRRSGARTLNELLSLRVPGFFLVEDQDDTIAGMRGLAPDNNSKMMLLLDGQVLNANWFWGPPDALLNGVDLDFIERIEVIRGPGSVTLGQGALLGVINIVTRAPAEAPAQQLSATLGEAGRRGLNWQGNWRSSDTRKLNVRVGRNEYDGEAIRDQGLARQVEQGLSVFERRHHLHRSEGYSALIDAQWDGWHAQAFRFNQRRDLYNWRRDREVVEQTLTGVALGYSTALAGGQLAVDGHYHTDDYALRSHGGSLASAPRQVPADLTLGGQREVRGGLRTTWTSGSRWERHRLAVGAEVSRYKAGLPNHSGDNFIVNSTDAVLSRGLDALNANARWAYPSGITLRSLFFEDFIRFGDHWEAFAAARWDEHPNWGSNVAPRLGMLWAQNERSHWRLSYQSGFRGAVGVSESGGFEGDGLLREANFGTVESNPYFAANGNTNLQPVAPETLDSLELAWRFDITPHVQFNAVAYASVVENVIGVGAYFIDDPVARAQAIAERTRIGDDVIGDWGGVFYFQNNDGQLKHRGFEAELRWDRPDLGWRIDVSHALVRVASADAGQFGPGNIYVTGTPDNPHARSFPEDVSRLQAQWSPLRFDGRVALTYTHLWHHAWIPPAVVQPDGSVSAPRLDGGHLGNLHVAWTPANQPALDLGLSIKNLWDATPLYPVTAVAGEESAANQGVPAREGRSTWLTLRYTFD